METSYYKGIAYRSLGKHALAKRQFENAVRLYKEGFHLSDVYCEMLDTIYLSDVEDALKEYTDRKAI